MPSKSSSKAASASKPSKSSQAALASPPSQARVVSRDTIDSDEDMESAAEDVPAKKADKARPKPRLVAEDSSSESASAGESSSDEDDEDDGQVQQGTSNSSKYLPPRNMQKVVVAPGSDFDYAALLANPALEVYTVRLPDNVKTKSLEKLSLSLNSSGVGLTGSLSTKGGEYIIKAADPQTASEELKNLRLLVPSAKSSSYVSAPRKIAGALALNPIVPVASSSNLPPSSASAPRSKMYVPAPKPPRLQPLEKMKFRNAAFGGGGDIEPAASVDVPAPAPVAVSAPEAKDDKAEKKSKKRKEVGEAAGEEGKAKKKQKKKTE